MKFEIIKKQCVESTNELLKKNYSVYNHGTVIIADSQTAGKGRQGRKFYSPRGGLYFSVLFKNPYFSPNLLTTAAAVAVMKGIDRAFGIRTQVKWVNDIFYENKKICGILCEGSFAGNRPEYLIAGFGINLCDNYFPDEIAETAGSLHRSISEKDKLLESVLECFSYEIENIETKKFIDYYKANCITLNRNVLITANGQKSREAFAEDIDSQGRLTVKYPDGRHSVIYSGEASVIIAQ